MSAPGRITAPLVLRAYSMGIFPMADSAAADQVFWVEPEVRGVLPLDGLHVSRSLKKVFLSDRYQITVDQCFFDVIDACAARPETWINTDIRRVYGELHRAGHAHSIEIWRDGVLAGGLYGVALAGAFFGESMFSRARDASKVALIALVARLRAGGFSLLDTQFLTPHLASLGAIEMRRSAFRQVLDLALEGHGDFSWLDRETPRHALLHLSTQTS